MVGPSGTGKTAVAAIATVTVGAKMCRVSAPGYMPCGANNRGTKETISVVADHVARNERTILVVDEIDKLLDRQGDSSWKTYIRGELFELLDGRWPAGLSLPDADDEKPEITIESLTVKLRHTVFICGVGTFQEWFDGTMSRRAMGFGAEVDPGTEELSAATIAERMPRELVNRFNSNLVRLPELTPSDYHRSANEIEAQLPLYMRAVFRAEVARLVPGAIAAKKGIRFVEEAMLSTLISLPVQPETTAAEILNPNSEIPCNDLCTL